MTLRARIAFAGLCFIGSAFVWSARGSANAFIWWLAAIVAWAVALVVVLRQIRRGGADLQ